MKRKPRKTLQVREIFDSISGEGGGFPQGTWSTFVRLQGCNLRCHWCDTEPTQQVGMVDGVTAGVTAMSPQQVVKACYNKRNIIITGGEPLLQADALVDVIGPLLENGRRIQIETNGSLPIPPGCFSALPKIRFSPIHWVMDYKCPSSGMQEQMPTIPELADQIRTTHRRGDDVYMKWVVAGQEDLEFALCRISQLIQRHELVTPHLISPIMDGDSTAKQTGRMLRENIIAYIQQSRGTGYLLNFVTFSVQLHKLLKMP